MAALTIIVLGSFLAVSMTGMYPQSSLKPKTQFSSKANLKQGTEAVEVKQFHPGQADHYTLELNWAGGLCMGKEVCKVPETVNTRSFSIHGLWPQVTGDKMAECSIKKMHMNKLDESTLELIKLYWSSLFSDITTQEFLEYEWEKHGTCWKNTVDENNKVRDTLNEHVKKLIQDFQSKEEAKRYKPEEFIKMTILLANVYNFYKVFEEKGIVPSGDKVYKLADIRNTVKEYLGVDKFNLQCEKNDGVSYLSGIRFCLDLDYKPVDCDRMSNSCRRNLKYPVHPLVAEEKHLLISK